MKIWQLLTILNHENRLLKKYLGEYDNQNNYGQIDVKDKVVKEVLYECNVQYYITSHGYLREMPENLSLRDSGIYLVEVISALEAYNRFGEKALTEVSDYGTFELNNVQKS